MKFVRVYTGPDNESHTEVIHPEFPERDGTRTIPQDAVSVSFIQRPDGGFIDFHPAPRRQYVLYLTASVEIGLGDGTSVLMEAGDVLQAEDTTGHGHTSTIRKGGLCAFVPLSD
ncbi:MAG: hypothetical protein O3A10_01760 [Chloroflexi bacterium]|nr:hypothetical protein [Chloroflexota bacterium]MDA1146859.1 hypothetical protein [Chloroflexota bacterium]